MDAVTLIVIIAVLWAVREVVISIVVMRSRRRYKHEYRTERTQSHFAEARNQLMRLALNGELDVNSKSFKYFYYFNTALMRRPDQYPEISHAMTQKFLGNYEQGAASPLDEESKHWTPAIKDVVVMTANAMDYIVVDYSWVIRLMFRFERRKQPHLTPIRMLRRIAKKLEEEKTISEIRRTQKEMYRMAGATA